MWIVGFWWCNREAKYWDEIDRDSRLYWKIIIVCNNEFHVVSRLLVHNPAGVSPLWLILFVQFACNKLSVTVLECCFLYRVCCTTFILLPPLLPNLTLSHTVTPKSQPPHHTQNTLEQHFLLAVLLRISLCYYYSHHHYHWFTPAMDVVMLRKSTKCKWAS